MDGTMLLSGSADCMVKLWHVDSRQCLRTFSFKGEYYWLEQKIDDEDARGDCGCLFSVNTFMPGANKRSYVLTQTCSF